MKRLQIQNLDEAGIGPAEIAFVTGVSVRTAHRIVEEPPVSPEAISSIGSARVGIGRPSKVLEFKAEIEAMLTADPKLKSGAIAERIRASGCTAKKSAIYEFVKSIRPEEAPEGIVRFEAVAGEFSQHDFGEVRLRYANGQTETVRFFASRLKYSRMVRIVVVANQTTETICHALVDAFRYFGGVPLIAVFDNPKTIVIDRTDGKPNWQSTFAHFCAEVGITPQLTWPYRPQEKGAVENLVGYVKGFFKGRVFRDHTEMLNELAEWHVEVNDRRPCRATSEIPRARSIAEIPRLRQLSVSEAGYSLKWSRRVRTDGYCDFESRRYFVGMASIAKMATLHVGKDCISIYVEAKEIARHPRIPLNGQYSILATQREEVTRKKGVRSYAKRQILLDLCAPAEWMLTEIRHRRPDRWEDDVAKIYDLLERHGEQAMIDAFIETARQSVAGAEYIEAILCGEVAVGGSL